MQSFQVHVYKEHAGGGGGAGAVDSALATGQQVCVNGGAGWQDQIQLLVLSYLRRWWWGRWVTTKQQDGAGGHGGGGDGAGPHRSRNGTANLGVAEAVDNTWWYSPAGARWSGGSGVVIVKKHKLLQSTSNCWDLRTVFREIKAGNWNG